MDKEINPGSLEQDVRKIFNQLEKNIQQYKATLDFQEIGIITSVGKGIAQAAGLPGVKSGEIVIIKNGALGMVFNLNPESIDIVLLNQPEGLSSGDEVKRTYRVMNIPVGAALIGRVIDPTGRPLDGGGNIAGLKRLPIEREAPPIMHRDPVSVPLQTGILAVDALIPIGRGQRELILGDRQTGKTAIAIDTILNQQKGDLICIYCAIGQKLSSVARVIDKLKESGAMSYSIVMITSGEDTPGLNYIAPYAATSIGEYFMHQGKDVLIIYDDLNQHARSYRELSLLLRRPPAREAYPGDIFYIHSRLLERATQLKSEHGGGSLTALPIIETVAQNLSAYIPTNLISITDGQIYLTPPLFQAGILPAIDIGKSVSRVGGKTQLAAYRKVVGDLRLSYSQFQELEFFARFGTQLDSNTQKVLVRGRRIREILKQEQYLSYSVLEQIIFLIAVTRGLLDDITESDIVLFKKTIKAEIKDKFAVIAESIDNNQLISEDDEQTLVTFIKDLIDSIIKEKGYAGTGEYSMKN